MGFFAFLRITTFMRLSSPASCSASRAHQADSRAMSARGQSADAVEGVTSFLEKRAASYPDKISDGLPELGLEEAPQWS